MFIVSQLSSQFVLALPETIRQLLNLQPGDSVCFNVINGQVVLSKNDPLTDKSSMPVVHDRPSLALFEKAFGEEWHSQVDDESFQYLQ